MVVATKFLPRTQEEIEKGITGQQHIESMIDTSLQNLGMDYVDLYIYHMWDWKTPLEDIMDGMTRALTTVIPALLEKILVDLLSKSFMEM